MVKSNDSKALKIIVGETYSFTASKIEKFKDLKKGWSYGEGVSFKREIVDLALKLNEEMVLSGFLETDSFPGADGSIMVTLYEENKKSGEKDCLEFTIHESESVTFVHERENKEICFNDNLTLQDAIEKIDKFRKTQWSLSKWSSSESLIQSSMTPKEIDLPAKHFPPPAVTAAFPY